MAQESFFEVLTNEIRAELESQIRAELSADGPRPSQVNEKPAPTWQQTWLMTHVQTYKFGAHGGYAKAQKKSGPQAPPPPRFLPPQHVERELTMEQVAQLQLFQGLGARLKEDFSSTDLKSEFRRLALMFHPDRHPGATREQLVSLQKSFTELMEAYQALARV